MTDFKSNQGSVSAGTDKMVVEGAHTPTGFNDGPKGEQVDKGPGPGIGANNKKLH